MHEYINIHTFFGSDFLWVKKLIITVLCVKSDLEQTVLHLSDIMTFTIYYDTMKIRLIFIVFYITLTKSLQSNEAPNFTNEAQIGKAFKVLHYSVVKPSPELRFLPLKFLSIPLWFTVSHNKSYPINPRPLWIPES